MIDDRSEWFDPARDKKAVEPFGFVDLKKAFINGVIESQIPETDTDYNGISDPAAVLGRPRDIFDAMQAKINAEASVASAESKEVKPE